MSVASLAQRAAAYGIPGARVDGNDVEAVHDAVAALAARARRGEGPALLECRTYRLSGHSRGDRREYRTREEEQAAANVIQGHSLKMEGRRRRAQEAAQQAEQLRRQLAAMEDRIRLLTEMEKEYEGFSRAVKAIKVKPSGNCDCRSLALCTAISVAPAASCSSSSSNSLIIFFYR